MPDITGDGVNDVDITAAGSSTTIGGVVFTDAVNVGSGTGGYNTFLAISNNQGIESGFNSDDTPPIDNTNKDIDQAKTHTVLLSSLVVVTVNGQQYYEVRVDLNEANSDPNAQISLDQFKVYTSTNGAIESTTTLFNPANATLKYDMDAGGNVSVLMSDAESSGSGTDDYSVLIPVSTFAGQDPTTTYVYFYIQMGAAGTDWTATSTFEEWNLQNGVTLSGSKFNDLDGDGVKDAGEGPVAGVTIFIDANQNGSYDVGERTTVTDANGNYSFFGVALNQTVWIDEVIPAGATQTTGAHETVTISANATPGSTIVVDPIGNHYPIPLVHLEKAATVPGGTANVAGEKISYTLAVSNPGEVALTGIVITDPYADAGSIQAVLSGGFNVGDTDHDNQLDLTETWQYTAQHTVTQGEIDINGGGDGNLENTATVNTDQGVSDDDDASVPVDQNPSLNIIKDVSSIDGGQGSFGLDGADNAGDVINYAIAVQNTGNITLTGVTVTDPNADAGSIQEVSAGGFNVGDLDQDGALDVGEVWYYTAEHTVTQAELDNNGGGDGDVDNIATADSNETGPDTDPAEAPLLQDPAMDVTKEVTSIDGGQGTDGLDGADSDGDVINYEIHVSNTGNITLTDITVTDPNADAGSITYVSGDTDSDGNLDVGEEWVYTATHTVTQAELDGQGIDNTGAIDGDGDDDNTVTADSAQTDEVTADASAPLIYDPSMDVTKAVTSIDGGQGTDGLDGADSDGDVINYEIHVSNTGNITLTGVTVDDPNADAGSIVYQSGDSDGDGDLDVGEEWVYTAQHTVTQGELDNQGIDIAGAYDGDGDDDNRVTADTNETPEDTADAAAPLVYNPSVAIDKTASVDGDCADTVGELVNYDISVTNDGNITLLNVDVTDDFADVGSIAAVDLDVDGLNDGDTDGDGELDVGETWLYTAYHTVTQDDIDSNGNYDSDQDGTNDVLRNVATVVADVINSDSTVTDDDDATVEVCQNPHITVDKTATPTGDCADTAGELVNYSISVTNDGNVTLENLVVTDPMADVGSIEAVDIDADGFNDGDTDADGMFDVGETWLYTAFHTVTQDEIDAGGNYDSDADGKFDQLRNVATADANAVTTGEAVSADDDAVVEVCQNPSVDLTKYVDVGFGYDDANTGPGPQNVNIGGDVSFKITIENTGNVTLTDVDVTDTYLSGGLPGTPNLLIDDGALTAYAIAHGAALTGDTDGDGDLDVGETWEITYTEAYDPLAFAPGAHLNTADVTDAQGATDEDSAYYFSLVDTGLCPRTPGFWQNPNNGAQFWDGISGNEKHAGEEGFPDGELLYAVDSNHDGVVNGSDAKGLLIGDYNKNGLTDAGEDTLFVSYADAQTLINASNKQLNGSSGDGRFMLGRDMVASWLNYLQGSGFGDASDPNSPTHYMDDAIDWMQIYSGTNSGGTTETFDKLKITGGAIKTSDPIWKNVQSGFDHSGSQMHSALDYYNNTGQTQVGGVHYANCNCDGLFDALAVYQQAHDLV